MVGRVNLYTGENEVFVDIARLSRLSGISQYKLKHLGGRPYWYEGWIYFDRVKMFGSNRGGGHSGKTAGNLKKVIKG